MLEEVALRCQELLFMITEQEPALEFVLLHNILLVAVPLVIFGPRLKVCTA